jgi:outer membrane immunogenic protein
VIKKILLGAAGMVAALGISAPATAADLGVPYTKAPMVAPPLHDWSGFYAGLNGGGGASHHCWDLTNDLITAAGAIPAFREGCHDATGAFAGGQLGLRWQTGAWVFGAEVQGDWADFKGSNTSLFYGPLLTNQSKTNAFGLLTGQVGYAWNNVLWYVKGGAALTNERYRGLTAAGIVFDQDGDTRVGGTVGTGIEFGFAENWSVAVEYDHMFMGSRGFTLNNVGTGVTTRNDNISQDVDIGQVRVNYRWGGPVIAKY